MSFNNIVSYLIKKLFLIWKIDLSKLYYYYFDLIRLFIA